MCERRKVGRAFLLSLKEWLSSEECLHKMALFFFFFSFSVATPGAFSKSLLAILTDVGSCSS